MPDQPNADLPRRERTDLDELRDWETVQKNETDQTERLRVLGGWIYRTISASGVAMVYVPVDQ